RRREPPARRDHRRRHPRDRPAPRLAPPRSHPPPRLPPRPPGLTAPPGGGHDRGYLPPRWGVQISAILAVAVSCPRPALPGCRRPRRLAGEREEAGRPGIRVCPPVAVLAGGWC